MTRRIRPVALGVARRGDDVLVAELRNPTDGERFYRPPGGEIEFRETSGEAVVREFSEELDYAVEPVGYIGTVENRFRWADEPRHELVIVHEVAFADDAIYRQESFSGVEDGGGTYIATWEPIDELATGDRPLYPEGLLDLLRDDTVHVVA